MCMVTHEQSIVICLENETKSSARDWPPIITPALLFSDEQFCSHDQTLDTLYHYQLLFCLLQCGILRGSESEMNLIESHRSLSPFWGMILKVMEAEA